MRKILVIRFSSIGDIVLTSPIVRCLSEQLKDTEIHYLTKKKYVNLVEHNPHISKIWTIEKDVKEIATELKKEDFDEIIDLHNNLRTRQVTGILKKKAHRFQKLNLKKLLLVRLKINWMPDIHIVDRYFETVKHLGIKNDLKGLDYFFPQDQHYSIKNLPEPFQNGYIAFAIGAQFEGKRLPLQKIVSLCNEIQQPIVLLGGPEDQASGDQIQKQSSGNIYNACGAFSLHQSASLVQQSNLVLTHDTGLMHIASAFQKKIASFWIATVPEFGMYPYLPDPASKIFEDKTLKKRPSSKLGKTYSYKDQRDAYNITNSSVIEWIEHNYE